MPKEDIIGGLKNALERGETLERAKSTFINAGYKEEEVEEAAKLVGEKKLKEKEIIVPKPLRPSVPLPVSAPAPSIQPAQAIGKPLPSLQVKPKKKSPITTVLIIVAVILFLLILNLVRVMLGIKIV